MSDERDQGIARVNLRMVDDEEKAFLLTLIDLTWGEAMEDGSMPRYATAARLIDRARRAVAVACD